MELKGPENREQHSVCLIKALIYVILTQLGLYDLESGRARTSLPLSGFKTPYIDSGNWADVRDICGPSPERQKLPGEFLAETKFFESFHKKYYPYPDWNSPACPIACVDIEAIFIQLTHVFGFQNDNSRNMFDYFMRILDSRSSRLGPAMALKTLHADYIGGVNSNFCKWYFAALLDLENVDGDLKRSKKLKKTDGKKQLEENQRIWSANMNSLTSADRVIQVALYLLIWGEANNVRFMPECLCFIFKCCNDYYYSLELDLPVKNITPSFLDHVITPIYNYYRDQAYHFIDGRYLHRNKDNSSVIGYDDMNQLFWYMDGLKRIVLKDSKTKLMSLPAKNRYQHLNEVNWEAAFYKTFYERRSWSHALSNFNRIWIIHISVFWYYTSFNSPTLYTKNYRQTLDNQPTAQAKLTVMSLGGSIASLFCLFSTFCEFSFVPRKWPGGQSLIKRLLLLSSIFLINLAPTVYLLMSYPLDKQDSFGMSIAALQFVFSLGVVLYLSIVPLGNLFSDYLLKDDRKYLPSKSYTASVFNLKGYDQIASYGLWVAIFLSKFLESYFFLTLSLRDPVRELSIMKMTKCIGEAWIGDWLCYHQAKIVLGLVIFTDLVLFFLDTYLWYIVWNTIFSVCRSFNIGVSIWTPWRNIFSRLPKRIFSKIIATSRDRSVKAKYLVSQVWDSVIISMYREHLLSLDNVQKLIYKEVPIPGRDNEFSLQEPPFFVSQEDLSVKSALFYQNSEAQRRITFFAQSLSTPMPDPCLIGSMPSFSVLVPHYSEKITFSLKEIIKEEKEYSQLTMLEYLKLLHPIEWACFVKDTKLLAEEFDSDSSTFEYTKDKNDDIQYHSVGYKTAAPEYILRTRIWASLRTQTLYRTISGFMNYSRAIKLLYDVEHPQTDEYFDEYERLEQACVTALRKFRMVVSMQRLKLFSPEEAESTNFLLRAYPELQIAYIDDVLDHETGETTYYSVLIDGACAILENGERKPKYRIKLSGNPILGDGKSDNQNHALIFCRREYFQLIDANQDNYLEECLKIRNILAEFEEITVPVDPYSTDLQKNEFSNPVAIIGTREYIFSENIGILGDVAAGKEQTFGTLFARTLAQIGGKLHYGHPDFMNGVFMTTRGGVSKAQKGLHLNEDIYAGMNAILRGGRIKHCEYMQCGKGRDLGFGSISNFTTKIGAGMGEQMLSREYFYLSTQLPLDRFLSFYYAHPGFHLNNVFIILSIQLFLLVIINLASLTHDSTICEYDRRRPITDQRTPAGCYNLVPAVKWLERSIYSILIVFFISFVPLCVQEVTERGVYKAATRLAKHFASFLPLFEVFLCKIYAQSIMSDISLGGARYIATGRGFATSRIPFSILYSRFASESYYFGAVAGLTVLYVSITMWKIPLLYFWFTVFGLLVCPCIYNPEQFSWNEFFLDYRDYLKWLNAGNSKLRMNSWVCFNRLGRSRIIGAKSKQLNLNEDVRLVSEIKPSKFHVLIFDSLLDLSLIAFVATAYLFSNSQNESKKRVPVNSILRIIIVTICPLAVNFIVLLAFFVVSITTGPIITLFFKKFPAVIAATAHGIAIINYVFFFELMWYFQNWLFSHAILGFGLCGLLQYWILKVLSLLLLSSEYRHDRSNLSWWSGKWLGAGHGWHTLSQPLREFLCKVSEMSYFVFDCFLGHLILFVQLPIVMIPYSSKWHAIMLFWLKPGSEQRTIVLSKKLRRKRRMIVNFYAVVFILLLTLFSCIFVLPLVATKVLKVDFSDYAPDFLSSLVQPVNTGMARKGLGKTRTKPY